MDPTSLKHSTVHDQTFWPLVIKLVLFFTILLFNYNLNYLGIVKSKVGYIPLL